MRKVMSVLVALMLMMSITVSAISGEGENATNANAQAADTQVEVATDTVEAAEAANKNEAETGSKIYAEASEEARNVVINVVMNTFQQNITWVINKETKKVIESYVADNADIMVNNQKLNNQVKEAEQSVKDSKKELEEASEKLKKAEETRENVKKQWAKITGTSVTENAVQEDAEEIEEVIKNASAAIEKSGKVVHLAAEIQEISQSVESETTNSNSYELEANVQTLPIRIELLKYSNKMLEENLSELNQMVQTCEKQTQKVIQKITEVEEEAHGISMKLLQKQAEEAAKKKAEEEEAKKRASQIIEARTFSATAYCSCYSCSEGYGARTSSGRTATPGRTIAASANYPFGTIICINGHDYVVEDRGGAVQGNVIDIYMSSHAETLNWGRRQVTGYIKRWGW